MQLTSQEQHFLGEFDAGFESLLRQCPDSPAQEKLQEIGRHLCIGSSSKRVRPLLIWHFSQMLGLDAKKIMNLSLATELIHSASLLHDDVVDNATLRRGRSSSNIQFSNSLSVLGGNFLLTRAFLCLSGFEKSVITAAIEVIAHMTEGALIEIGIVGKIDTTIDTWKEMVAGKTGALFAWCGAVVGIVGGDADAKARFSRCGRQVGMAFQLADDLKDLTGDAGLKDSFSDLRNGEPSYPILLAAQKDPQFYEACKALWKDSARDGHAFNRAVNLLRQSSVAKLCGEVIGMEICSAIDGLGAHVEHPSGQRIASIANKLRDVAFPDATAAV